MKTKRLVFASVLLLLSLSSCSSMRSFFLSKTPNPELKATLVQASGDYLRHVVNGDFYKIGNVILWKDFLDQADITKEEYHAQLMLMKNRWKVANHPLLELDLVSLRWDGENEAKINFRRSNKSDYPVIKLEIVWNGTGWLVTKDNLFGKDRLITRWTDGSKAALG